MHDVPQGGRRAGAQAPRRDGVRRPARPRGRPRHAVRARAAPRRAARGALRDRSAPRRRCSPTEWREHGLTNLGPRAHRLPRPPPHALGGRDRRARAERAATSEVCVLLPERKFNGAWHRILHDQTAESMAREISASAARQRHHRAVPLRRARAEIDRDRRPDVDRTRTATRTATAATAPTNGNGNGKAPRSTIVLGGGGDRSTIVVPRRRHDADRSKCAAASR